MRYFFSHVRETYSDLNSCGGDWYNDLTEAIARAEEYAKTFNLPRIPALEIGDIKFYARIDTPPMRLPPNPQKRKRSNLSNPGYFISPTAYMRKGYHCVSVKESREYKWK
jgi:hypothetical protein